MGNKKKAMLGLLIVVLLSLFVNGYTYTDYFTDNSLDLLKWENVSQAIAVFNHYNETSTRLYFVWNGTENANPGTEMLRLESKYQIPINQSGYFEFDVAHVSGLTNLNDLLEISVGNRADKDDTYTSAPPSNCGVAFVMAGGSNVWSIVKDYPSASALYTGTAFGTNVYTVRVSVVQDVGGSATAYFVDVNGEPVTYDVQTSTCGNIPVNLTISAYGYNYTQGIKTAYIDNFIVNTDYSATSNGTGDNCNEDSDCECGKCDYGSCVQRYRNEPCTEDECCLSGLCNNNKCTNPGLWTMIDESKSSVYGDDEATNNFLAMLFIVGIPVIIILGGRSAVAVAGAVAVFYALTFFFTFVGWLSAWILLASVMAGLVLVVVIGVLKLSGE